ncbi:MAG: ATP-binding cassette domain-containing protein [Actinobacteria bacterium]|nr:ATP-binding cassette domain-containing protein [Actinomycetota bacterium]
MSATAAGAPVAVRGVTKRFGEQVVAVRGVSLDLAAGEFVLLTGPSGSGKSTLLNLIAGFDRADEGSVTVDGVELGALKDLAAFRREVLGFVFQLHHLIEGLSLAENVEVALLPDVRDRAQRRERVARALADVGLEQRAGHLPGELSGGERQRGALARALVGRPRLILADEPTGALDSVSGEQVMELLHGISRREGTTVLLVSHDQQSARWADRALAMRDGQLVSPAPAP